MHTIRISLFLILVASSAAGQVRTWVSTSGVDTNPCSRPLPCRTFLEAIAAVDSGGEVVVLDSGGYGPVTINKGVSVVAPKGIHAAVAPTSGVAIFVNTAAQPVILSNLYLNGQGASVGIQFQGTGDLYVKDCVANGFVSSGFSSAIAASGRLFVSSSEFRNNGNTGLRLSTDLPGQTIIDRGSFHHNAGAGLVAIGTGKLMVHDSVSASNGGEGFLFNWGDGQHALLTDCVASGNGDDGFLVFSGLSTVAGSLTVHLERCTSSGNDVGLQAAAGPGDTARIFAAGCTIVHNGVGIAASSGQVISRLDNTVVNNAFGETFSSSFSFK